MSDVTEMERMAGELPIQWDTSVPGLVHGQDAEFELLVLVPINELFTWLKGQEPPSDAKGAAFEHLRMTIKAGRGVELRCDVMEREGAHLTGQLNDVPFAMGIELTVRVQVPAAAVPDLYEMCSIARIRLEVSLASEFEPAPGQMRVVGQSIGLPVLSQEEFDSAMAEIEAQRQN